MAGESLIVTEGRAAGTRIPLTGEFFVGRSAEAEGRLADDPALSREHARLERSPGGTLQIEDLRSTNGTFVNGDRLTGLATLTPGDTIKLGTTTIKVLDASGEVSAAATPHAATAPAPPPQGAPEPPPQGAPEPPPQFLTEDSMATYQGMSVAVIAIWTLVKPLVGDERWVCLVIAAAAALALQAITPPQPAERTLWRKAVIAAFLFVVNTAVLSSAALGINAAAGEVSDRAQQAT